MTKLKCWKKLNYETSPKSIIAFSKVDGKIIWVQKSSAYNKSFRFGGANKRGYMKDEYFKTKKEAIQKANSYMKKQDRC